MTVGPIKELLIDRYEGSGCLKFVRSDGSQLPGILLSRDQVESIMALVERYEPGPAPPRTRYRGLEIGPGDQMKSGGGW